MVIDKFRKEHRRSVIENISGEAARPNFEGGGTNEIFKSFLL